MEKEMPAKAPCSNCYIHTKVLFPQTECDEKHKKALAKNKAVP